MNKQFTKNEKKQSNSIGHSEKSNDRNVPLEMSSEEFRRIGYQVVNSNEDA